MMNSIKSMLKFLVNPWVPAAIIAVAGTAVVLNTMGFITLPHITIPSYLEGGWNKKEAVYDFSAANVGKPFKYDFSPELVPLLKPGSSAPYTFYLGSGVGFPPMGLSLDPFTGVLSGTPKVAGTGKFEVCVKDVGGASACRTYAMPVEPKTTTTPKTGKTPTSTPTPASNTNTPPATGFSGVWEGEMIMIWNREDESVPDCGNAEYVYQLNLTQKGNKLTGTMTVVYTKKPVCNMFSFYLIGVESTSPLTGTVTGTSVKFSGGTTDYTLTLTGNTLIVNFVGCHNPDPRCWNVFVPSPEGSGVPDAVMDMPWWFTGESTATRKK